MVETMEVGSAVAVDRIVLSQKLREKRDRMFLTQTAAAKAAGVNYHSYVRAEQGVMGNEVRAKVVRWLCKSERTNHSRSRR